MRSLVTPFMSWIRIASGFRTDARPVFDALARHRSRASLARLDQHMLDDIGLTRDMAADEAAKPVWRD